MTPHSTIDITAEHCPMTFVRTKLALEKLQGGQILAVLLKGDEPLRNVPRAVEDHGHQIVERQALSDGQHRLLIRVKG